MLIQLYGFILNKRLCQAVSNFLKLILDLISDFKIESRMVKLEIPDNLQLSPFRLGNIT